MRPIDEELSVAELDFGLEMSDQWYCSACLHLFAVNDECCPNPSCSNLQPKNGWGRVLNSGELIDSKYSIHQMLAVGGGGITYLAQKVDQEQDLTGPLLAIKVLFSHRESGRYLEQLTTEAAILQQLVRDILGCCISI